MIDAESFPEQGFQGVRKGQMADIMQQCRNGDEPPPVWRQGLAQAVKPGQRGHPDAVLKTIDERRALPPADCGGQMIYGAEKTDGAQSTQRFALQKGKNGGISAHRGRCLEKRGKAKRGLLPALNLLPVTGLQHDASPLIRKG